jgi:large subunit ribosomal protein L23
MSIINKFFTKKKKSDELVEKGKPQKTLKDLAEQKDKKDLTLQELKEREEKVKSEKPQKVAKEKKHDTKDAYRILIKPLITEKGTYLNSENKYIFEVAPKANKISISKAIWSLYGVRPVKVNIIKVSGKKVRYGRIKGKTKNWKKAVVTLKSGESISVYEGV